MEIGIVFSVLLPEKHLSNLPSGPRVGKG